MTPVMPRAYLVVIGAYLALVPMADLPQTRGLSGGAVLFGMLLVFLLIALFLWADDLGDGNVERLEAEADGHR